MEDFLRRRRRSLLSEKRKKRRAGSHHGHHGHNSHDDNDDHHNNDDNNNNDDEPVDVCPTPPNYNCDATIPYRSPDGTCNNLNKPLWGSAARPLSRLVEPDYGDGIGTLREAKAQNPLPSARHVSLVMNPDLPKQTATLNLMHMCYGQFTDHDLGRTAISMVTADGTPVDISCGADGCTGNNENYKHCRPISVPADDPAFTKPCIKFVRTAAFMPGCEPTAREQANVVTGLMDASHVYGSDSVLANRLRIITQDRGQLDFTVHPFNSSLKSLLPQDDVPDCRETTDVIKCFLAGDDRVNEQPGLTSLQTVFMRFHNFIEKKLYNLNNGWNGERLYQETRKIVTAAFQHITYDEYLPTVLGPDGIQKYRLDLLKNGFFTGYDSGVNANIINSFSTAAFRFGHSEIGEFIRFITSRFGDKEDVHLSKVFNSPSAIYNYGVDAILLGMMDKEADAMDMAFSESVTTFLFSEQPTVLPGIDLLAMNLQRGRDHGLPGYNAFREYCGLEVAQDFDGLKDIIRRLRTKLKSVYNHVDDIDLFVGGIAETRIMGGMVGPTFACIIGQQFRNTRVGDRFWYEREETGFTEAQLTQIRKYTLARILCDNLDNVQTIQKYVTMVPRSVSLQNTGSNFFEEYHREWLYQGDNNERRPCSEIPEPNFSAWKE